MNAPRRQVVDPPPSPSGDAPPRKRSSRLLWILLLIALLAFGWYHYSQRAFSHAPDVPPAPIGTTPEIGDGTEPPPASERTPPTP